jgi:hypothetical protein
MAVNNFDLAILSKIAEGDKECCVISGCNISGELLCPEHLAQFGRAKLVEAKLWIVAMKNYNNENIRFKVSYNISEAVKKRVENKMKLKKIYNEIKGLCPFMDIVEEYYKIHSSV